MTYVLSYLIKVTVPVVKRRPWWKFWGRDQVDRVGQWDYVSFEVDEEEARILMSDPDGYRTAARSLFMKGATKGGGRHYVDRLQLEEFPGGTNYIKTTSPSSEPAVEEVDARAVLATVNIRRGEDYQVKPEAEQLDGRRYVFRHGWVMDDDDPYPGESAWIPNDERYPLDAPIWIASGDLSFDAEDE